MMKVTSFPTSSDFQNNVEAFGESIEVDDVEVATVVGGPLDEDTDEEVVELLLPFWLPLSRIS